MWVWGGCLFLLFIVLFYSAYKCPIAPIVFVEKAIIPPLNFFCTFVKNQLDIPVWVFTGFSILLHYVSFPPPRPYSLSCRYIIHPESRWADYFFFSIIILTIQFPLTFHINFWIILLIATKLSCWDFYKNWVKPVHREELLSLLYWVF